MYILIWNNILSLLSLTSQSLFHSAIIHLRYKNLQKLIYTQVCTSFIKVRSVKRYGVKIAGWLVSVQFLFAYLWIVLPCNFVAKVAKSLTEFLLSWPSSRYHLTSLTVSSQLWESNMTRFHTTPLIWTLAFLQSSSTLFLGRPNWRTSPKTTKCQMWSASLKLSSHLLPFRTREELKFQIEDQNRWDVRLLWGTIAGKNMIYQAYMFFVGIYSIPLKYFIFISNKKHSVNSIIYEKYIQIYLMKHKWQNFGWS